MKTMSASFLCVLNIVNVIELYEINDILLMITFRSFQLTL